MSIDHALPATCFVDADNTLWDTDQIFAAAQLQLLATLEQEVGAKANANDRLGYVRAIDQAIAARHHAGLRYPPKLLARGIAFALQGQASDASARAAWSNHLPSTLSQVREAEAEQAFFSGIRQTPALRPGVLAGLEALRDAGTVTLIVSESPRAKVEATAEKLGLAPHFTRIIEGQKRPDLYRRVLRLTGAPQRAYMIGDQLDRDIAPAKAAGLTTIYFPGGFVPAWTPDEAVIGPDFRIDDFRQASKIIISGQMASDVVSIA